MSEPRTFVIANLDDCRRLQAQLQQALTFGDPIEVTVRKRRAPRSVEQNALMWQRLDDIAQGYWPAGRQFAAKVWNEQCKIEFLPDVAASGKPKWIYLPTGERILGLSTSDLSVDEMNDYLRYLEVFAVENGVTLRA